MRKEFQPFTSAFFLTLAMLFPAVSVDGQSQPGINVGKNVHVSVDFPNDGLSESWISADPTNPNRLLACSIVYPTGLNARYTAVFLSTDGGFTWRSTLNTKSYPDNADPACTLGPDGVANHIALVLNIASVHMAVYRSTDGGATWQEQDKVTNPGIDRESIIVDATGGKYHGRVYVTAMAGVQETDKLRSPRNGVGVWTSTNGGVRFDKPIKRASPANRYTFGLGNSVVLKDGTLLTLFGESLNPDTIGRAAPVGPGHPNAIIEVVASTNGGETYEPAVKVADKYMSEVGGGATNTPSLAADPGSSPFGKNAYVAWTDFRVGRAQILFSRSTDSGKSWSSPNVVNDVWPDMKEVAGPNVFMPSVAVNRDGVVLVTWYDRHDTPGNLGWRLRARASLDGGESWLPSVAVSSAMNSYHKQEKLTLWGNAVGGGAREYWTRGGEIKLQLYMQPHEFWASDYSGLAVDAAGVFHPLWTDNRTGTPQLWTAPITVSGAVVRNGDPLLAPLADVSEKVAVEMVGTQFDRVTGKVGMTARLINTSTDTLRAPFKVRALGMSSQFAEVVSATNASNSAKGVGAVWDFTAAVPGGVLLPNAMSESQQMSFSLKRLRPLYGEDGLRKLLVDMRVVVLAKPIQ